MSTFYNDDMDVLQQLATDSNAYKVDRFKFSTPALEDFYAQDLSPDVLKDLQDSLSSDGNKGSVFYVESPYETEPGYYEDAKVFIIRATPVLPGNGDTEEKKYLEERAKNTNAYDGDTLQFYIDSIQDGGLPFTVGNSTYESLKEFIRLNVSTSEMTENGKFSLRLVGVNAPEIPHYSIVPEDKVEEILRDVEYGEARVQTDRYVIDKSILRHDRTKINFVRLSDKNKYHEIIEENYSDELVKEAKKDEKNKIRDMYKYFDDVNLDLMLKEIDEKKYYKIVASDESKDYYNATLGLKARDELVSLLSQAEDTLLMIDNASLTRKSGRFPDGQEKYDDDYYFSNTLNMLRYPWDQISNMYKAIFGEPGYKYLGFNMYGQDAYKRFLGALYVKIKVGETSQWVNTAKYLISKVKGYEIIPDYTSNPMKNKNGGFLADAFKIWTYDSTASKVVEFLSESEMDDRRRVQKQLGYNFDNLKDWTVMIGDCLFMVPPTSIRCVTQTTAEKVPLLRSRGSMVKAAPKSERLIEMTLYFNNDDGINGKPFEAELPAHDENGNPLKLTYYMNGLRTLISMFKLTPFLPIENHYINKILNIEAVSLVNLQISTMPGYPRCIAASLTLQEFNYHIYMPELPIPDRTDEDAYDVNLFAKTINFETMRWHYQRPILKGEAIKNLPFTDPEYINATFGQRTALQPMKFLDPSIEFYVIDKEFLDQRLQLKMEAANKPLKTQNKMTDDMRAWAKQFSYLYDMINSIESDENWQNAVQGLIAPDGEKKLRIMLDSEYTRYGAFDGWHDHPNNRLNATRLHKSKTVQIEWGNESKLIPKFFDPMYDIIVSKVGGRADEVWMEEDVKYLEEEAHMYLDIDISVPSHMIPDSTSKDNFLKIIAGELYQDTTSIDKFFNKSRDAVRLRFVMKFGYDGASTYPKGPYELDRNSPGYKFLRLCALYYGTEVKADNASAEEAAADYSKDLTSVTMMDEIVDQKAAMDYETPASFEFVKYPLGDINITNMSCVFGNTLTRMSLKALDGFAPQYCGGQDTVIEITLQTMDENTVSQLNHLPRMAAQYVRDYRLILNCWPLRINSEITRLLGVNEVLVEGVDISTVPGQPGLFNINMRLTSVDRTSRNRESLKKIDTPINAGSKTISTIGTVETKNFFDLKSSIAKAEIYPDLELPTIDELEYYGFKFIRYANREKFRIYPDPDFYFVYSHVLGCEVFRDTILNFTKEDATENSEFQLSDVYAASFNILPEFKNAYSLVEGSQNDQAKEMINQQKLINEIVERTILKEQTKQDLLSPNRVRNDNLIDIYNSLDAYQSWDIADNITCMFRERKYLDALGSEDKVYAERILYKANTIIDAIDRLLDEPIQKLKAKDVENWNSKSFIQSVNDAKQFDSKFIDDIHGVLKDYYGSSTDLQTVFNTFDVFLASSGDHAGTGQDPDEDGWLSYETFSKMIAAAADAMTGETNYISKSTKGWKVKMYINAAATTLNDVYDRVSKLNPNDTNESVLIPYCRVDVADQGDSGIRLATNLQEAMDYGVAFGPFQIKWYKKSEIEAIEGDGNVLDTDEERLFLDPYYRKLQMKNGANDEEVLNYKRSIMMDPKTAIEAFFRNILFYLKQLLKDGILLSLYEIIQDEAIRVIEDTDNEMMYRTDIVDVQVESDFTDVSEETEDSELKKLIEKQEQEIKDALNEEEQNNLNIARDIRISLKNSQTPLILGKLFAATTLAITSKSGNIYNLMKERNYDLLNQIVRGSQLPNSGSEYYVFTKFIYALVGRELITSMEKIGTKSETATSMIGSLINEKVYIEAADDPAQYIRDSFFDMIVNDKRGRMARAFPTYYMVLIDEGREIGLWKLHDNFYNISSIAEIQVTKSRKIAADTARIVMTNMYNSYTTDDEDAKDMGVDSEHLENYQYTWKDVFSSIFSPRTYFIQEELKRLEQLPTEKAQIKPGIRIHLRMGYSADASELPIVFNGVIAEVGAGEVVELICQGDGIELTNPILSTSDAEDVQHQDDFVIGRIFENWFTKGATPRTILGSLLTTRGGWMKKEIYKLTSGRFFNDNPYGIVHFGDPQFIDIFQGGECVQNIYEACHRPTFGSKNVKNYLASEYMMDDVPRISSHVFGKSYWDIMHICAGASPDFIASIVPFGLRSSIFYGMPRYYYAYDYVKQNIGIAKIKAAEDEIKKLKKEKAKIMQERDKKPLQEKIETLEANIKTYNTETKSVVIEKRKPFQQFHIYTSFSDIIGNNIIASSKDVKTCAVGLYQRQGVFGKEDMARVGPMWVDFNIYPEKQRTMTVDTQFLAKGVPVLGDVLPFLNGMLDNMGAGKKGSSLYTNGYEIAWRITARALKDSIKDMYQGELIVIGDPTVKPYDKMWIQDMYEQMQGCCEVEAVVHNFNVNDGFTTSIFADCISVIDDRHEQITQNFANNIVGKATAAYLAISTLSYIFASRSRPFLNAMVNMLAKGGNMAADASNALLGILGKDEILNNEKILAKADDLKSWLGINTIGTKYDTFIRNLENYTNLLTKINAGDIKDMAGYVDAYNEMAKALEKINPEEIIKSLESASKTASTSKANKINTAIKEFSDEILPLFTNQISSNPIDLSKSLDGLQEIIRLAEGSGKGEKVADAINDLKRIVELKEINNVDDIAAFSRSLKTISANVDNVDDVFDMYKLADAAADNISTAKKILSVSDDIYDGIKASSTIAKGAKAAYSAVKSAFASTLIGWLIEEAITVVVVGFAYEYIERWMKNLQVLQIFPLKKKGSVLTAGLDGHKGIVVGSPTEKESGLIDGWLGEVLRKGSDKSAFNNFVIDMLASQEMQEIASKFRNRNNVPEPNSTVGIEFNIIDQLKSLAESEVKIQAGGYNSGLMIDRVTDVTSDEGKNLYKMYSIQDTTTLTANVDIKENMVPLEMSAVFKNAIQNDTVILMHTTETNQTDVISVDKTFNLEGDVLNTKILTFKNSYGKVITNPDTGMVICDLPFVRPDVHNLLREIYNYIKTDFDSRPYVPGETVTGFGADTQRQHPLTIYSALRAGENKWTSTGFAVRIGVTDYDLKGILDKIQEEKPNYFMAKEVGNGVFDILVYPKK